MDPALILNAVTTVIVAIIALAGKHWAAGRDRKELESKATLDAIIVRIDKVVDRIEKAVDQIADHSIRLAVTEERLERVERLLDRQ